MKLRAALVGVGFVGAASVAGYLYIAQKPSAEPVQETATVHRGQLVEKAMLTGQVKARVQVDVKSRASGEIIEIEVNEGDLVEEGDILLRLDPIDEERALATADAGRKTALAQVSQARAALAMARTDLTEANARRDVRLQGASQGLISEDERRTVASAAASAEQVVSARRADLQAAQAQLQRAEVEVSLAQQRLKETTIRAPIAGTVLAVHADQGAIVASGITNIAGGTPLVTIGDLSSLYVVGSLDEADIGRVSVGDAVTIRVDAFPEASFSGHVERIAPMGQSVSNVVTFDVDVLVTDSQSERLRPGMTADLEVITATHENALLVPVVAIRSEGGKRYLLKKDGKRARIELLGTDGTSAAVRGDVQEGDAIVVAEASAPSSPPRRGLFGPRR